MMVISIFKQSRKLMSGKRLKFKLQNEKNSNLFLLISLIILSGIEFSGSDAA